MPKGTHRQQDEPERPDDSGELPDLASMSTWHLAPSEPVAQQRRLQIEEHEAEVERLYEIQDAVTSAINTLRRRIEATADPALRAVLEHNQADLEAYREELNREGEQHDNAIKRLWAQQK